MPGVDELLECLLEAKELYWYDVCVRRGDLDRARSILTKRGLPSPEPGHSGKQEVRFRYAAKVDALTASKAFNESDIKAMMVPVWKKRMKFEDVDATDVKDAYSFARGGHIIGDAIIQAMQEFGLTDDEIVWVFRSKHYRWFLDMNEQDVTKLMKKRFKNYLEQNSNRIQGDISKVRKGEEP